MSAPLGTVLRDAATDAPWPPTPDLRAIVVARIEAAGLRPEAGSGRPAPAGPLADGGRGRAVRLGRAIALAVLALLVAAGIATALGFRLPGLDLIFVERLPPAGSGLDLGRATALAEATAVDPPRVLVPAALPPPDVAYVRGTGDERIVTLAYRAAAGAATLPGSDLSLTVMAIPGDEHEAVVSKLLGPGTTLEAVVVGGSRGWWIAGAPHEILYLRPDGSVGRYEAVLAGDTLVFARDGTLYRLESALGREATLRLAGSMR